MDVRDAQAVDEAMVSQVKEFNHRLDVFVASAGILWTQGPMTSGELAHYQDVMKSTSMASSIAPVRRDEYGESKRRTSWMVSDMAASSQRPV